MPTSETIRETLLLIPPLLFALTVHEFSHGWVAWKLGDPTAKDQGRLTLNPIAHLDLMGTLCILFTRFIGWAKPVPVDPRRFRDPVRGMAIVAAAGPASNFLLALLFAVIIKTMLFSGIFGLLPQSLARPVFIMMLMSFTLNLGLGLFNLLPFPPLDGFRVASVLLPLKWVWFCERYSFVFFMALVLLMLTGVIMAPIRLIILNLQTMLIG
ncbi:MAG: site-2 protease family protein [Deltaproteobacteria bacterium]|jgi:Zn-dependent protease|nr:site-2 protease family protein [Deltaproteobacteria bacterium]